MFVASPVAVLARRARHAAWTTLIAPALMAASALACGSSDSSAVNTAFPDAPWATTTSEARVLAIEVRTWPEQPPARGVNEVQLVLRGGDGLPLDGVQIHATPWMVAMGHGSAVQPTVRSQGAGTYVLGNVSFFMPGRWELRTSFAGAVDDRAILVFDVP